VNIVVIGDENTVLGLGLAGIQGEVVHSADEARACLDQVLRKEGVKIVLITERWADELRERVEQVTMTTLEPVLVEIPGPADAVQGKRLREIVQRAIGLGLGG
jgi:V/A-type H+-transporting ATPase subunit F